MHDRRYRPSAEPFSGDWKVITQLLPYLWQYKYRVGFALALLLVAKGANVLVPVALKHIVDGLDTKLTSGEIALAIPITWVLAYGIFRFSAVLFSELRDAVFGLVSERTLSAVGLKLFHHLHSLDLEYHLSRRTGGLSRDIERGTQGVSFLLRAVVFSILPIIVELSMVIAIMMASFSGWFVVITLGSVALYIFSSIGLTRWRTRLIRKANEADSQANTRAIDSLINFETVKYFNNEQYEANHYHDDLRARERAKIKSHRSLAILNSVQSLIIALGITSVLFLASHGVTQEELSLGDLAMINALMIQVFIPLNVMGFIYRELSRALADVEAMFRILEKQPSIVDIDDARTYHTTLVRGRAGIHESGVHEDNHPTNSTPEAPKGSLEFVHVSFAYHKERQILRDISFSVPAGKKVAIVGPSGSGKSTLARLLYRFYDVDAGRINLDGINIKHFTLDSLRRTIGIVPQDCVLFNDSLLHNIQYGSPHAAPEAIEAAIDIAHLRYFIEQLPNGYETKVGERGLKVSGGEKQRIAIARTVLKNPLIFVFDEATSSLDSASEQAILLALGKAAKHRTTLVIAHRLSTITDADNIVVLKEGEIAEQGRHQELLARRGVYHDLWTLQQDKSQQE